MNETVIAFNSFTFKYRSQKEPTLIDINLDIRAGEKKSNCWSIRIW